MKAVDLAKVSGVGEPMISRYRKGDQVWVSPEDMERLCQAISDDPLDQAELLRAHLLDECHGPAARHIQIEVLGESRLQEAALPAYGFKLPSDLEQHLAVIRENVVKDQNVREIVEGLGRLLSEGKPTPRPPSSGAGRKAVFLGLAAGLEAKKKNPRQE